MQLPPPVGGRSSPGLPFASPLPGLARARADKEASPSWSRDHIKWWRPLSASLGAAWALQFDVERRAPGREAC
eukprot:8005884-Alexandrium_andersonii.AAC.1